MKKYKDCYLLKFLLLLFLSITSISAFAVKAVEITSLPAANLEVGMSNVQFTLKIKNIGDENLGGATSIKITTPQGIRVPYALQQASIYNDKGELQRQINGTYNIASKLFSFTDLQIQVGETATLTYFSAASYEAMNTNPSDKISYSCDGFSYEKVCANYDVVYPEFLFSANAALNPDWNTVFEDKFIIKNSGLGSNLGFAIYVDLDNEDNIKLLSCTLKSVKDPSKTYVFQTTPSYIDWQNRIIVYNVYGSVLTGSLGFTPNVGFEPNSEIEVTFKYKEVKLFTSESQVKYQVKWNAWDVNQATHNISSDIRLMSLTPYTKPTPTISYNYLQVKRPTPCDLKGEDRLEIKNTSLDQNIINSYLDIAPMFRVDTVIKLDSVKIGNVMLKFKNIMPAGGENVYVYEMPSSLENSVDAYNVQSVSDLNEAIIANDILPGGYLNFTFYYTFPDLRNKKYERDFKRINTGECYCRTTERNSIVRFNTGIQEDEYPISVEQTLPQDIYVGESKNLSLKLFASNRNVSSFLNCNLRHLQVVCTLPKGYNVNNIEIRTPSNTLAPEVPKVNKYGSVETGWVIKVETTDTLYSRALYGNMLNINVSPTCDAIGEDTIGWDINYICNTCQDSSMFRHLFQEYGLINIIPNATCQYNDSIGDSDFAMSIYPSINLDRTNFGYYDQLKSGSIYDKWYRSDLTSGRKIVKDSPIYNQLLAENKISPNVALVLDTTLTSLKGNIYLSPTQSEISSMVAVIYCQSELNLFNTHSIQFEMAGKVYPISIANLQTVKNGAFWEYYITINKSDLNGDSFVEGEVCTKVYSTLNKDAVAESSLKNINYYRGRYIANLSDGKSFASRTIGEQEVFKVYHPEKMKFSSSFSHNNCTVTKNINFATNTTFTQEMLQIFKSEFRDIYVLDSIDITIPEGYLLGTIKLTQGVDKTVKVFKDKNGGTILRFNGNYVLNTPMFSTQFSYDLLPQCNVKEGKDTISTYVPDYNYNSAFKNDAIRKYYSTLTKDINLIFPADNSQEGKNYNVSWNFRVKGYSSLANYSPYYFLKLTPKVGGLLNLSVTKVKMSDGTELPIIYSGSEAFVKIGKMRISDVLDLKIEALYSNCPDVLSNDTLLVTAAWSCDQNAAAQSLCDISDLKTNLVVLTKRSSWQMDYNTPEQTYNMCQSIPVDVNILSSQEGKIQDLGFYLAQNPTLSIVDNKISYKYGTNSGVITDSLYIPGNQNISTALFKLNGLADGFPYTGDSIKLHFDVMLHCLANQIPDLSQVGLVNMTAEGYTQCGKALNVQNRKFNISFKGFEASEALSMSLNASSVASTANRSTINVAIDNKNNTDVDSVFVEAKLPLGYTFVSSSIVQPQVTVSETGTTLIWELTAAQTALTNLSFVVENTSVCGPNTVQIPVRAYMLRNIQGCESSCLFQKTFGSDVATLVIEEAKTVIVETSSSVCAGSQSFTITIPSSSVANTTWALIPSEAGQVSKLNDNQLILNLSQDFVGTARLEVSEDYISCVSADTIKKQEIIVNALPIVSIATSTPSICAGASASLSASGAESFVWSTGETTSNISVNPSSTTVYTVQGTNASGCVSSASQEVVVNALPTVAITPSETSICNGASASLQASGAATYSWSTGETASSITVSPTASAVYTVTGTDANACVASASVELTVTECGTPCKVNAGADITVCAGTAVSLNAVASDCLLGTVSGCAAAVSSPYTCSSNPINAYNQNLTLNPGDVVYVGNYSGNIQMNGGTMVICGDNTSLPYLNINGSGAGEIVVNGTVNFSNININNQNLTLKNYGTCNFLNNTCNAAIENYGVMNFAIDFETKKSFYNGGTINASASFNSRAKIVNEGKLTVANVLHNNGGSDLKNTCTIQAYQFINDAKAENSGTIAVTTETILNGSSIYYSKAGSILSMKTLMMNANVTGDATGCSTLKITERATINGGAKCTGMVTVCGITTTASTAFNSSVTYGCACAVGAPAGLTYVWTPSAGLSNANVANPTILNPQTTTTYTVEVTTASGEKVSDNVTVTVNDCTPEPVCSDKWDKSSLQVTGVCQSGFVVFTIRNTGELGGGDMTCYSPVRVYVDGVLYVTDQVRLKGGESIEFKYEANASTWRLEADQHPAHPGKSRPNAVVEACGGSKIDSGCGGKKPVVAKSCGKGSKSNYSSDKGSSCSKRSAEVMFEEQLFTLELSVRPNPILTVGALVYSIPEGENATIRIYSQTGMLVAEYKALVSNGELSVSASELPSGIYIAELKASNGVSKQMKFTVK